MLAGLGKGLLLRLGAYALFVWGFWLLFQAFERSSVIMGIGGGAAILAAMWAMVGFRRLPPVKPGRSSETGPSRKDAEPDSDDRPKP